MSAQGGSSELDAFFTDVNLVQTNLATVRDNVGRINALTKARLVEVDVMKEEKSGDELQVTRVRLTRRCLTRATGHHRPDQCLNCHGVAHVESEFLRRRAALVMWPPTRSPPLTARRPWRRPTRSTPTMTPRSAHGALLLLFCGRSSAAAQWR